MNQATFIPSTQPYPYAHFIKSMGEASWWVFRYDAQYQGKSLPASRVVFYAKSLNEAEAWIKTCEQ